MLVKFSIPAGTSCSMFEKDAVPLIRMMGYSEKIPSAIFAEDIEAALQQLETALAEAAGEQEEGAEKKEDTNVGANVRAFPLIELLKKAIEKKKNVMWEYDQSFF